jgi:hypothetical protein
VNMAFQRFFWGIGSVMNMFSQWRCAFALTVNFILGGVVYGGAHATLKYPNP